MKDMASTTIGDLKVLSYSQNENISFPDLEKKKILKSDSVFGTHEFAQGDSNTGFNLISKENSVLLVTSMQDVLRVLNKYPRDYVKIISILCHF
jgi:hypothetical protein